MTYFEDLVPCSYFHDFGSDRLVAIGWLDSRFPYRQGEIQEDTFRRIMEFLAHPWRLTMFLGRLQCGFCPPEMSFQSELERFGIRVQYGTYELYIPAKKFVYVAPSTIVHYIDAHQYAPPEEFCDAVMNAPQPGSIEYAHALWYRGPQNEPWQRAIKRMEEMRQA